ncbi:hypothetical protein QBC40DRAFT_199379 [Triangularia verruculosa]|uniref:Uncharacterized protein n=1 Tax=Triangularia verruculosa TaxID=2587418 RepID=A0AAN7AVR3_9PEZI|nr:hypothetical protein QBC40DRAFT_199379 [Triangularia verruculosa]
MMASMLAQMLHSSSQSSSSSNASHVTDAPEIPRTLIGPAANHLQNAMMLMYWAGVKRELPYILLTLRKWRQQEEYSTTVLADEKDRYIHGYETFLDQVNHSSRKFSNKYRKISKLREPGDDEKERVPTYTEALEDRGWDIYSEMQSSSIRHAIMMDLQQREVQGEDILRRRARLLLQSAQFLDMDKIIEYRDPEALISFWKQPTPAQVTLSSFDEGHMPILVPQTCGCCSDTIRGSIFRNIKTDQMVCEACYRKHFYGHSDMTKVYKQCCLRTLVSAKDSQEICNCIDVQRRDSDGQLRNLFPVDNDLSNPENHLNITGAHGKVRCGLYELTDMTAEAKFASCRSKGTRVTLGKAKREHRYDLPRRVNNISGENPEGKWKTTEFGASFGTTTKGTEDVPFYLNDIVNDYPYGNVHMALRIGPLVIENGVSKTHGGVLITSRDPPNLQVIRTLPEDIQHSLLLTGKEERKLYSQQRPRAPKRYKAMLKQVVGGSFCGFFEQEAEDRIIDALLGASLQIVETGISTAEKSTLIEQAVNGLMKLLKDYLGRRIEVYISSVVAKLLDQNVDLRWSFANNNCQTFVDNIIDRSLFSSLFAPQGPASSAKDLPNMEYPLYLMSFVCRQGAYVPERARSKYDVPNGLTEEYLLKFRYGRHDESDMADALSEYWYDWGAFEGPIYPYQDLFPWDCTEAFNRYPVTCGSGCNISKHVWAFPFDSWSLITFHLARPRHLYPHNGFPADDTTTPSLLHNPVPICRQIGSGSMPDKAWFENRLSLLLAQDTLLVAATAMARCATFRQSTLWLHKHADERVDRLKLGGIHRAQPFSHHYEKGAYHQYFVAGWSHLSRRLKIAEYERLRDWKATREDVGSSDADDGSGGAGGCGFLCGTGGVAAGAACSGVAGEVGDTCGTGCVSTCSSCGGCGGGCGGCGG